MKSLLFYLILRIYRIFCRIKSEKRFNLDNYEKPVIYAFWHESILFLPFSYNFKNRKVKILISTHNDGKLASGVIKYFKLGTIEGSSNREPKKAFLSMLKNIKNDKIDIGITPDGPKGPRRKVKDGVLELAYLTKYPIVPIFYESSSMWRLHSWDRFAIPKPFSVSRYLFLEPVFVKSKKEFQEKRKELEDRLNGY